jgi:hypothetical protein
MVRRQRLDDETLVEPQGVNAADDTPEEEERREPRPPRTTGPDASTSDEMVGAPGQRPGYPGQQRSVDTG